MTEQAAFALPVSPDAHYIASWVAKNFAPGVRPQSSRINRINDLSPSGRIDLDRRFDTYPGMVAAEIDGVRGFNAAADDSTGGIYHSQSRIEGDEVTVFAVAYFGANQGFAPIFGFTNSGADFSTFATHFTKNGISVARGAAIGWISPVGAPIADDAWHMACGRWGDPYGATGCSLRFDGVQNDTPSGGTMPAAAAPGLGNVILGGDPSGSGAMSKDLRVAEAAVYFRKLSDEDCGLVEAAMVARQPYGITLP
jgi:hypothetical protein